MIEAKENCGRHDHSTQGGSNGNRRNGLVLERTLLKLMFEFDAGDKKKIASKPSAAHLPSERLR